MPSILLRDPRVPWYAKAFTLMIAAYVVSPIDLVPDSFQCSGKSTMPSWCRSAPPDEHRRRAAILAEAPTDWRVGAAVIVFRVLAAALVVRWIIILLTGASL